MYRSDRFSLHIVLAFAGTLIAVHLIEMTMGLDAGVSVLLTLPLLIAAMLEGQHRMRVLQDAPSAGQCWIAALGMGAITCVLFVFGAMLDQLLMHQPLVSGPGYRAAIDWLLVAVCAVCAVPLLRIGYAIGVTSEQRNQRLQKE